MENSDKESVFAAIYYDLGYLLMTSTILRSQGSCHIHNLLVRNRELRAGADVFRAILSKNLIPRYSDKHYLKKDDEEEKKMSSHSASHGLHCNCVAQQSQLIKEVQLSPDFGNGFLHIMYACNNSMISSLTLH
ncbi:hypothetical protein BDL97_02G126800 [Sphagnum fallax]|nr:hypothetical protein BDL97_02G126800 [Sphagnum fallax]